MPSQGPGQFQSHGVVGKGQDRVYTLDPQEVHTSNIAIIGTIFIDKLQARVLFDSRATHSFTSLYFANKLVRKKTIMKVSLAIGTPLEESIEVRFVYPGYVVEIGERNLLVDLIELAVFDFDVILGMAWLSENYASIDCNDKCVRFRPREGIESVF